MQVEHLFAQMGLGSKQAEIFLTLYKLGSKPASTIAKLTHLERTHCYKLLQWLVRKYLVEETVVKGVKHFFVPDKKVLQHLLEKQRKQLSQREDVMPLVESELAQYDTEYRSPIPKIQLFQGREGIQAAFDDLYHYCSDQGYRILKCFASNTLESQTASKYTFQDIEKDFLERLEKQQIALQSYIGNGIMMLEYVTKSTSAKDLLDLPAGHSSVYLFLTGKRLYTMIFKEVPLCIKLENEEIADVMHFLLNQIG